MIRIGLTGSIGMGKSTTARLFAEEGVPVWDADSAVHRLYAPGGEGTKAVAERFPGALGSDGAVDREALSKMVLGRPDDLRALEAIIHPLVRLDQEAFLQKAEADGAPLVLLDIPLLAEGGMAGLFDEVVVVTADEAVRRARVLQRSGMTEAKLDAILARQADEASRLDIADHVIRTDDGIDVAREEVRSILTGIREKHGLSKTTRTGLD
jgi:dephospho-CoA kinase